MSQHLRIGVCGESGDIQSQQRVPSHGVDIGNAVGRGDLSKFIGIGNGRGEYVNRVNNSFVFADTVDSRIVGRVYTDQKVFILGPWEYGQCLRQLRSREFGRSTGTGDGVHDVELLLLITLLEKEAAVTIPILGNLLFECWAWAMDIGFRIGRVVLFAGAVMSPKFPLAVGHQPNDLIDPVRVRVKPIPFFLCNLFQALEIVLEIGLGGLLGGHD